MKPTRETAPLRRLGTLLAGALAAAAAPGRAETEYPVLAPRFSYAHVRHAGESRAGSVGVIRATDPGCEVEASLSPVWLTDTTPPRGALRFEYAFKGASREEFAGAFLTFGRIAVETVRPDGTPGPVLDLHEDGTWDFERLALTGSAPITIEAVRLYLRPTRTGAPLTVRAELEDRSRGKGFRRFRFAPEGPAPVVVTLPLDGFRGAYDGRAVKLMALVIEETHVADGIRNPPSGGFDILGVCLVDRDGDGQNAEALLRAADRAFVAALAWRDFETLWRLSDPASGACLDRTLFRDLLHWGATGWLLAALPFAEGQGWLPASAARARALTILRFLDDPRRWGDRPAGCVGNSVGIVYRFGGIDPAGLGGPLTGTRKIDPGRPNAAEASVIDTALLELGIAVCARGFSGDHPEEAEIRTRAAAVLARTRWDQLVEPASGQFYMAWKPERDPQEGCRTPAAFGGFWASRGGPAADAPLTIDWWTAEGAMAALLAVGSATSPVSPRVWYAMRRESRGGPVLTWPGSWFTYAFLSSTYLDPGLGPDRGAEYGVPPVDWHANACSICEAMRRALGDLPALPDAVELPDTAYEAQGLPGLATGAPRFTGTVTPYSLQMALGLGGPAAASALAALRQVISGQPEVWDPLAGLLDSLHPDLAAFPGGDALLRRQGPWVQNQKWTLNTGAALIAQLNYLTDGAVWRTAMRHDVLERAVRRIYREPPPQ